MSKATESNYISNATAILRTAIEELDRLGSTSASTTSARAQTTISGSSTTATVAASSSTTPLSTTSTNFNTSASISNFNPSAPIQNIQSKAQDKFR